MPSPRPYDVKANPTKVKGGTPGATNTRAAETRRITRLYGVPLEVVPFNGNSEVQAALPGGNVTVGFVHASQDVLSASESGLLRPLAVGTPQRLNYLDAPTFVELGIPNLSTARRRPACWLCRRSPTKWCANYVPQQFSAVPSWPACSHKPKKPSAARSATEPDQSGRSTTFS
ncbi:hypothetical protein MOQ72_17690 [Saccharopolyspora sp. K220]|uniref:tripartite tricarboxylate transporter substrate-binding protein n=1 Tax=Saccharopolyspora soli TaxID=2926618 RepID=UPI001F58C9AB|nr:tripartite tricarboxylate transporter substrate-binding protein [Saccharopolyspora soli]MCI2419280.1 hypothetical protein [Saccharopolyspora soli]